MTCDDIIILLEDFADGSLAAAEARDVSLHVDECPDCLEALEEIRRENAYFAAFAERASVPAPSWEAVAAAIAAERPAALVPDRRPSVVASIVAFVRPVLAPLPLAAAAAVVLSVGSMFVVLDRGAGAPSVVDDEPIIAHGGVTGDNPEIPRNVSKSATAPAPTQPSKPGKKSKRRAAARPAKAVDRPDFPIEMAAAPEPGSIEAQIAVARAESVYSDAIRQLSMAYEARKPELGAATAREVDSAIADLDRSIDGSKRVVAKNPTDADALQYLLTAYSRKVDVLRDVAAR